jgi:hypothetical protein
MRHYLKFDGSFSALIFAAILAAAPVYAAPVVAVEGRVLIRDFMPQGCETPRCGSYPRIRPVGDVEVVASNRRGQVLAVAEVTPNGNFFFRLRRGRYTLVVPALGISREVVVRRAGMRGVRLNLDVY